METFSVIWIKREFMKMSPKYREIRSALRAKMDKCWWCDHRFDDGEMMGLVHIKGKTNKVFCQGCIAETGGDDE
jgi:hypothetical protein